MDMEKVLEEIKKRGSKKVYLQVPEGLKTKVQEIADSLNVDVIISCEPVWGACDIRDHEAKKLGCDLLLHVGHTDFGIKPEIDVLYVPYNIKYNPLPVLEKDFDKIKKFNSFNLVSTAQHIDCLSEVRKFLEEEGKKVVLGNPGISQQPGQILGCDQVAALREADCILFIGSGRFHPLGILRKTDKPVFVLDTDRNEIVDVSQERDRFLRIKFAQIEKAREGKNFGIVVSSKPGQMHIKQAEVLKKKLEFMNKKAWILVMDFISKEKLMGIKLDVLVNCACPRLDEDFSLFGMPILNPEDVDKLTELKVL